MARKSRKPLQKVTVNLYEGDFAELAALYPQIGPSTALREILRKHLREITETIPNPASQGING